MKRLTAGISAALGLFLSLPVHAELTPGIILDGSPIEGIQPAGPLTTVYDGIAGPYFTFPVGTGVLGADDYASIAPGSTFDLATFQFMGGVNFTGVTPVIDRSLLFEFLDGSAHLVGSFSVGFPQSGNFIWTLNLPNPIPVASTGFVQISTLGNSRGQWFLTATPPIVGNNDLGVLGVPNQFNQAFAMKAMVPEPGSFGMIAIGLVGVARRRLFRN